MSAFFDSAGANDGQWLIHNGAPITHFYFDMWREGELAAAEALTDEDVQAMTKLSSSSCFWG